MSTRVEFAKRNNNRYAGYADVWDVKSPDEVVLVVRGEQYYAPGARGESRAGVTAMSASEAREVAALLLAAADEAEGLA